MRVALVAALCAGSLPLGAQPKVVSKATQDAVAGISEDDVRRRIEIIAHDSMGGRDTPSRGLESTAAYIAREFERLGLRPAGDSGSFVQRYPLTRIAVDTARSNAIWEVAGQRAMLSAARDLMYVSGQRADVERTGSVLLISHPTPALIAGIEARGRVLLVVGPASSGPGVLARSIRPLLDKQPSAVLALASGDSAAYVQAAARQGRLRVTPGAEAATPLVVSVREGAVAAVLAAAGVDLSALRRDGVPAVRDLALTVSVRVTDRPGAGPSAPNVAAILHGSDPALRNEYVVFSAHMDHEGINTASRPDSIWNGADDDASGTAGVLELAEAFAASGVRPRRSLLFVLVSGEEKGLWGSEYFTTHPPVPIASMVANINLDMIGRNWRDTIAVIGKQQSDLGRTLDRVSAAHPELRMRPIDDPWPDENFYSRSDHYHFARQGVPVLFFFNGTHADYHEPSDTVEKIDAEKEARILRLVYCLGLDVANGRARPMMRSGAR